MKLSRHIILLIFSIALLSSCSKSSDKLTESIPAGSQTVMHIDMESLIKKSNYNIFENATVKRGINMVKAFLKDESAVKLIEDFQQNSGAFGITLNKDIYFFSKGTYYGLLLPVNDAKKIKESLTKFNIDGASIKSDGGTYSFTQSPQFNIVWNADKLLILIQQDASGSDTTQISAEKLLKLDKKESIASDKNFEKFSAQKQDISIYYSSNIYADLSTQLDALNKSKSPLQNAMNQSSQQTTDALRKFGEDFKGVSFGSFISFETGKITMNTQYYYETPEAEAKMKKLTAATTGEISDKYLQYISQAPIISFVGKLKGSGYYNILAQTGLLKAAESEFSENGIDLKSLIESVNGNIVFSLNDISLSPKNKNMSDMDAMLTMQDNSAKPKFKLSFLAELSPNNQISTVIESLIAKQPTETIKKTADGQYTIKSNDFEGFFGVKNNTLYFTTEASTVSTIGKTGSSNYANKVKGKSFYVYGDMRPLQKVAANYFMQEAGTQAAKYKDLVTGGLSLVETVEGSVQPNLENQFSVNFSNKKNNSLASIFQYLDQVLTKLGAERGL